MMLWLIACGGEASLGTVKEEQTMPSAYVPPEQGPPSEPLTLPEIEAAIPEALEKLFTADPRLVFDAYDEMMSGQDSVCPTYDSYFEEEYGRAYWEGVCTAESGMAINGYSEYLRLQPAQDEDCYNYNGLCVEDYGYFVGDAVFNRADGQEFVMSGFTTINQLDYGDYRYWRSYMTGSFIWDGTEREQSWLGDARDYYIRVEAYQYDIGARYLWMDGALGDMDGRVNTVYFTNVLWYDTLYGTASGNPTECVYGPDRRVEPGGSISLRDDNGRWYEVLFDGYTAVGSAVFPPLCDGCGEVFLDGVSMGQVCPDFSALDGWGENTDEQEGPWQ